MSERTATRIVSGGTVLVGAAAWGVCAWLLWRTSVPSLDVSGLDEHRYFPARELARATSFGNGERALWFATTVVTLAALIVLGRVLPRRAARLGLGRISSAVVIGMLLLTVLWAVRLPFGLAGLWWQHHYGLGPFGIAGWLDSQWSGLGAEAVSALAGIVLLVGLAGRVRRWWLPAGVGIVAIAGLFALLSGWLDGAAAHPLRSPALAADVQRLERAEHVTGTPVGVQDVSSFTRQVNAFTSGYGPSTHVVLWNTLLDGRFTRGEIDVVIAHELGHVRSRHVLKAIGWTALVVLPTLWLLALALRRRGGLGRPENLPAAVLVLFVLTLVTTPIQNAVSRRYEAEADWRALNATRDPAAAAKVFEGFASTSLEEPDPPLWDYVMLENHPTLAQRVAMTREWSARHR